MDNLPSGTVTFLFTDVEGSTRLWQAEPAAMHLAIDQHLALLGSAVDDVGGVHFKTIGDAIQAAFPTADAALAAAVAAQRSLTASDWGDLGSLQVRMALHAGSATPIAGDYLAPCLNRLSRLLGIGHGGQILLSETAYRLLEGGLPAGVDLRDLGAHRLRDLLEPERVWQVLAPGLPDTFPPLTSIAARPHNLPTSATPLVGRENEVSRVMRLLVEGARLVTLTGSGGSGKTRLALEVAAEILDTFSDGVWFLDLAALSDSSLLLPSIASTLGVREQSGQSLRDRLLAYLAGKRVLLVLDNLEQFRPYEEVAGVIAGLLTSAPTMAILATSRAPLQLQIEHEEPVRPLPVPDPLGTVDAIGESSAVQLFVARAQAARPGFALTAQNASTVASLCHRLDGLPLALELVAARVRALSPADILARLSDKLDLAVDRGANRPDRQRTLEATVSWSHDLLNREDQFAFRRLAVFVGGTTLEAAETVLGAFCEPTIDVPATLENLVAQSMLRVEEQSDGSLRYRMLETVRASALTRLRSSDEDGHAQRAHADFYRTLVPIAPPAPWSIRDEHVQFDRLTIEHDNLRAALAWMLASDSQDLLAFTTDLTGFWWERGHGYEARTWCERALANDRGAPTIARARVLLRLGLLESGQDELHQALMHAEDSLRLARQLGSGEDAAAALGSLGGFLFDLGDLDRAGEHLQQSRDVYQNLGSQEGIAWASWRLSWVAEARGDIVEMEALASTVLEISRELGQPGGIAASLQQLGRAAKVRGDLGTAKAHFVEGLALVEKFGMLGPIAGAVELLGDVAREEGELDEARTLLARSQAIYKQLGWTRAETFIQYRLAMLAADSGDVSEAVRQCDQVLVELRQGEATWDLATVLIGAGRIRAARGDPSAGAANYHEGLSLFHDIGNAFGEAAAVRAIGVLAADCGRAREASRLLGSAMVKREALGAALLPSEQRQEAQATDLIVAALGDANFASLREEGRTLAWDVAITEALVMACDIAA